MIEDRISAIANRVAMSRGPAERDIRAKEVELFSNTLESISFQLYSKYPEYTRSEEFTDEDQETLKLLQAERNKLNAYIHKKTPYDQ